VSHPASKPEATSEKAGDKDSSGTPAVALGSRPPGTASEGQASKWVRSMFEDVAPKYDLLNHILSFNIDRLWRRRLVEAVRPILDRKGANLLDLCCGTGDVLLELQQATENTVLGVDFCHPMLVAAHRKIVSRRLRSVVFEGDALVLPLRNGSLDLLTIAFGFRNLTNYEAGLRELHRVLKPQGQLAILEFSHPRGWLVKASYGLYSEVFLPAVGGLFSGSREAYEYLPASIRRFPRAEQLRDMMTNAGFRGARFELLNGGIAALHVGEKN
jgi:demethylmenaquinone methyltransferase / 2-methoxy-6-polyprenyl-1,4-benzoquinol methylase